MAGRTRFADRRTIEGADGTRTYLCGMCRATAASCGRKDHLSDEKLRQFVEDVSAVGVLWSGGGLGVVGL